MREICQTLGFNKSTFYYQPKIDTSEDALQISEDTKTFSVEESD